MRKVIAPETISLEEIRTLAQAKFGDMIKGVVDLDRGILLLDADRSIHCTHGAPMTQWQHDDVARGRWQTLTLAEQFGNVGSEVSRAIRWSTKDPETARAAFYRGLELFDLMLDDPRHRACAARLREIARAREVTVDFLAGVNEYGSTGPSLQKYFDQFAVAARRMRLAR